MDAAKRIEHIYNEVFVISSKRQRIEKAILAAINYVLEYMERELPEAAAKMDRFVVHIPTILKNFSFGDVVNDDLHEAVYQAILEALKAKFKVQDNYFSRKIKVYFPQ
jgi:hypothetical protein